VKHGKIDKKLRQVLEAIPGSELKHTLNEVPYVLTPLGQSVVYFYRKDRYAVFTQAEPLRQNKSEDLIDAQSVALFCAKG